MSDQSAEHEGAAELARSLMLKGWKPPPPPRPTDHCAVCGEGGWYLTDVTVTLADGNEGHSEIRQYRCDLHLDELVDGLRALGFVNHEHGGTCLLHDTSCPGSDDMAACPTPSDYGLYVIGRRTPSVSEAGDR